MGFNYFVAVAANRLMLFVLVLALSYLLDPAQFGVYSLAAANALTVQIVAGSWISSAAYKFLTTEDEQRLRDIGATMLWFVIVAVAAILASFLALYFLLGHSPNHVLFGMTAAWSVMLLFYDVSLASLNARGKSGIYTSISLTRSVMVTILSLALVMAGLGVGGAILGQIIGTVLPFLFRRDLLLSLASLRPRLVSSTRPMAMVLFGFVGAQALGHYMLIHGVARNVVFSELGAASTGAYSLTIDLFYAPLALVGTAYSLAQMRALNQTAADPAKTGLKQKISDHVQFNLALVLPYALAGPLLAPDLVAFVAAPAIKAEMMAIAGAATVQASFMLLFAAMTTLLLIFERKAVLVAVCGLTIAANALAIYWVAPTGLAAVADASTGILAVMTVLICLVVWRNGLLFVRAEQLVRIALSAAATAVLVCAVLATKVPGAVVIATLLGGGLYLALVVRMSLIDLSLFSRQ
ncbi:MAG: hypothetical protein ABL908_02395 [Hyphomicrobium sp.]